MSKRKLKISRGSVHALEVGRSALHSTSLVYLAVANKALKYPRSQSKIAYIGTTGVGGARIFTSAAALAPRALYLHGVNTLKFYAITCMPRQKVKTWRKLERGLILKFREQFGAIPKLNTQGKNFEWTDEKNYFTDAGLAAVVKHYS
jgi:hypothetical protein